MTPASTSPPPKRVVFVEGITDERVVAQIRERNEVPPFTIRKKGGVHPLLKTMAAEIKVPDREVVAFMLDANDNFESRWQSVRDHLNNAGVTPPKELASAGIIIAGKPKVGVWIMPDNASTGELEDFVKAMIPDQDPVWPCSKRYIANIREEHRKFKPQKTSRAEVYAWIATRETPGQLGTAIRARDLDTSGDLCRRFSKWIGDLFG